MLRRVMAMAQAVEAFLVRPIDVVRAEAVTTWLTQNQQADLEHPSTAAFTAVMVPVVSTALFLVQVLSQVTQVLAPTLLALEVTEPRVTAAVVVPGTDAFVWLADLTDTSNRSRAKLKSLVV